MQNSVELKNNFNIDEILIEIVSKKIINFYKEIDDSSQFDEISIVNKIKKELKAELKKYYSDIYIDEQFEEIFERNEERFLEYFNFKAKLNNIKNTTIQKQHKKNIMSGEKFQIKQYIDIYLIKKYKKNKEKLERVLTFSRIILFEKRFISKKDNVLKEVKSLYKVEMVNCVRSFKSACKLPFAKTNELLLFRIAKAVFLSIPLLCSSIFSGIVSVILFILWQFNNIFNFIQKYINDKQSKIIKQMQDDVNNGNNSKNKKNTKTSKKKNATSGSGSALDFKYDVVSFFDKINKSILGVNKFCSNFIQKISSSLSRVISLYPNIMLTNIEMKKNYNNDLNNFVNNANEYNEESNLIKTGLVSRKLKLIKQKEKSKEKSKYKKQSLEREKKNKEYKSTVEETPFMYKTQEVINSVKDNVDKNLYYMDLNTRKENNPDLFLTKISVNELNKDNILFKSREVEKIIEFKEIKQTPKIIPDNDLEKKRLEFQNKVSMNTEKYPKQAEKFVDRLGRQNDIYLVLDDFNSKEQQKDLMKLVKDDKVQEMYLVGKTGEIIQKELQKSNIKKEFTFFENIDQVLAKIKQNNIQNDLVVLSPKAALYEKYKIHKTHAQQLKNTISRCR